jgi:mono/diheme cytochrome c family protein
MTRQVRRFTYLSAIIVVIACGAALHSTDARAQEAALLYKIYCAKCHGASGKGDGADAATLETRPRDFRDCRLMATISDDTMVEAIKDGGAAVNLPKDMPAFGVGLSDDQISSLVKYVRAFCRR